MGRKQRMAALRMSTKHRGRTRLLAPPLCNRLGHIWAAALEVVDVEAGAAIVAQPLHLPAAGGAGRTWHWLLLRSGALLRSQPASVASQTVHQLESGDISWADVRGRGKGLHSAAAPSSPRT